MKRKAKKGSVKRPNNKEDEMQKKISEAVLAAYKIPQCLTEGLTANFILDLVDFSLIDSGWDSLDPNEKFKLVGETLETLEKEGRLSSKSATMKSKHVQDDIEPPKIWGKMVKTYSLIRKAQLI